MNKIIEMYRIYFKHTFYGNNTLEHRNILTATGGCITSNDNRNNITIAARIILQVSKYVPTPNEMGQHQMKITDEPKHRYIDTDLRYFVERDIQPEV